MYYWEFAYNDKRILNLNARLTSYPFSFFLKKLTAFCTIISISLSDETSENWLCQIFWVNKYAVSPQKYPLFVYHFMEISLILNIFFFAHLQMCTDCVRSWAKYRLINNKYIEQVRNAQHWWMKVLDYFAMPHHFCVPLFFFVKSNYRQYVRTFVRFIVSPYLIVRMCVCLERDSECEIQLNRANDSHYLSCVRDNVVQFHVNIFSKVKCQIIEIETNESLVDSFSFVLWVIDAHLIIPSTHSQPL